MKIVLIMLVWAIMAAILVTGVVMAVNGVFWLLILGVIGFIAGICKYGIFSH